MTQIADLMSLLSQIAMQSITVSNCWVSDHRREAVLEGKHHSHKLKREKKDQDEARGADLCQWKQTIKIVSS